MEVEQKLEEVKFETIDESKDTSFFNYNFRILFYFKPWCWCNKWGVALVATHVQSKVTKLNNDDVL